MKYKKEQKPKQGSSSEDNPSSPTLSSCSNQSGSPNSLGRTRNVNKVLNDQQIIVDRLLAHSPQSNYNQSVSYPNHNNIGPYPVHRNAYKTPSVPGYGSQYQMTNNLSYNDIDNTRLMQNNETNYLPQNDLYSRYQSNYQMFPTTIENNYETRTVPTENNINNYSNCMFEKNNLLNEADKVDYNYNPTINVSWIGQNFVGNSVSPTLTEL